ncbi:MAG: hypothetical protein IKS12_01565 [Eubacterium sp.]|nr:hypothetical protein [Eubacterium sp.]MBR7072238.1 hypothetical protein [Eubacterium sp.]
MNDKYLNKTHTYGRLWMLVTLLVFLSVPCLICYHLGVKPELGMIGKGLASVALVFYPTAVIEVITYSPLLGTGGTYLGFVTGNITNLKMPVALSAMESAKVDANSDEGEVISTISIAASSIVTTIIIAVFVLLFRPLLGKITGEGSPFAPAFQQVTPALFGALCASYLAKHWKISILPIVLLTLVLLFKGTLAIGVLIPVGVVVSLLGAHLMFKKGLVGRQ